MVKARSNRTDYKERKSPRAVRIRRQQRSFPDNATLKELLATIGRVQQPGGIAIYSGVAQGGPNSLRADLSTPPLPGWGWMRWTIDAPPAGAQVLWLTLELATQWWRYSSCISSTNKSDRYQYADFGVSWRWMLLPDQYDVPGAPATMQDNNTYEFYASKAPGDNTWNAWWILPARGVTLTPAGKESDPNALSLLLRSEQNGRLGLMFAYQFPWIDASCYTIHGGPSADSLRFSMAVALPRPSVSVGDLRIPGAEMLVGSAPLSRAANRRRRRT